MQSLTLQLDHLTLQAPLNQTGESLVLTTLVLPRPGIQRKSALQPFRLRKGTARLSRRPFYETALLKEKVDGQFGLRVQLTKPLSLSKVDAWLRGIAALGLETTGDLLAAGLQTSALRPLLREPFDALADELTDDAPEFIVHGGLDLHSESLTGPTLTIPLQLSQRLRISPQPPGPKSRDRRKPSAQTYKKGLTIGEALIKIHLD